MGLLGKAALKESGADTSPDSRSNSGAPISGKPGGLLSRASKSREPDDMGRALRDRILRLSRHKTAPYTALNLLKAYSSFQTGICLSLKGDLYLSYASVGLGIEKITIPRNKLAGQGIFRITHPESLSIGAMGPDTMLWAFPLDTEHLLLLGGNAFNPQSLEPIIRDVREILIPPEPAAGTPASPVPDGSRGDRIRAELIRYHANNPRFQGIILESADEQDLAAMIAPFGVLVSLPSRRSLILCPPSLDRELTAHRLSADLKVPCLGTFEADNPEKAFELIQAYL
jgi:hypothetical protein